MTTAGISLELFLTVAGAVGVVISGFWAITKVAMRQYEARQSERFASFATMVEELKRIGGERLAKLETKCEQLEADVRRILIELPREYVARTDYVRRETVIEAKLDQLSLKMENWVLREKR